MSRTYRNTNNIPRKYRFQLCAYNKKYEVKTFTHYFFNEEKLSELFSSRSHGIAKKICDFIISENAYDFRNLARIRAIDFFGINFRFRCWNSETLFKTFSHNEVCEMLEDNILLSKTFERKVYIEDKFSDNDNREGFWIYKTKGYIGNYRVSQGAKADKRQIDRGIDCSRFDGLLDYEFADVWQTKEELEFEQDYGFHDFQHEMEYFHGVFWEECQSEENQEFPHIHSLRKKTACRPIWDDKISTGFIKKYPNKKFRESIRFIGTYI